VLIAPVERPRNPATGYVLQLAAQEHFAKKHCMCSSGICEYCWPDLAVIRRESFNRNRQPVAALIFSYRDWFQKPLAPSFPFDFGTRYQIIDTWGSVRSYGNLPR